MTLPSSPHPAAALLLLLLLLVAMVQLG